MKILWDIIEKLGKIAKKVIIETHTDGNYLSVPAMIFYPNKEINNDVGTFWGMNIWCIKEMLEKAGFKITKVKLNYSRAVFHAVK